MSAPKFAVGEVVILQSKVITCANGERTVLHVASHGCWYVCPVSGVDKKNVSGATAYILDDGLSNDYGKCIQWGERVLRKRHQPGEHTFDALMASLNTPVSRDELARLDREVAHG